MPIPKWTQVWSCDESDLEAVISSRGSRWSTREFMDEMHECQPGRDACDRSLQQDAVQAIKARWQYLHLGLVLLLLSVAAVWFLRPKTHVESSDPWAAPVDFYLPNRGHVDSHGAWRADTWDHFQIPQCDTGPKPGDKELVKVVEKVKTWVNDTKGVWVPGMWRVDPNNPAGGHWEDAHMEYKGHFEWLPGNVSKWVQKKKTAKQLECVHQQDEANAYHQKLIAQHQQFLLKRHEMEALLRWQGEHGCHAQSVDIDFSGASAMRAPEGAASGAMCQKICTLKGYDGFSWRSDGCMLKSLGASPSFQAVEKSGTYSGYACSKEATYLPWITDEAQKHTLYDGVSSTAPPTAGMPQSTFCFTLIEPYTNDVKLVSEQARLGKGIFSCDHSAVYSSQLLELPNGLKTRKIYASQMVEKGGQWNVELNTDVSLALLREVVKDPEWRQVKWIVRADPQSLFSMPKLRGILGSQEASADVTRTPTYLVSPQPQMGLPAFFQVLSSAALQRMAELSRSCFWSMRYWGDDQFHDSMWIDQCLRDTVHARRVEVPQLVNPDSSKGCGHSENVVTWPLKSVEDQRSCA